MKIIRANSGASAFEDLTDTPSAYAGQSGKTVTVKGTEDGVEFTTPSGAGDMLVATYDPAAKAEQLLGNSDIVTTVGSPGSDTKIPSEQGTREALNAIDQKKLKATYFATIASGTTTGQITKPADAGADVDFVMDEWGTATDALVSLIENGKPTFKSPVNAGGATITTTFDAAGNYTFSAAPSPAAAHALIYVYTCYLKNFNVAEALWETELLDYVASHAGSHADGTDDIQSATAAQKGVATAAQITKLDGIETAATKYPDTGEQAFLDADHTKLNGIETAATIDQTGTEIVTLINAGADLIDDNNIASSIARDSELHAESHNVASHSDTTATGVELNDAVAKKHTEGLDTNPTTTHTPGTAETATLDLDVSRIHDITMPAGNITVAVSNENNGDIFTVRILQDGTGSRTVTWFSTIRWAEGNAPTLTTTANKADTCIFRVIGIDTYDGFIVGQDI